MPLKEVTRFQNVPRTAGTVHTYPTINRWDPKKKVIVRDNNESVWIDTPDGFAREAIAYNETHALITVRVEVDVPEEKPTPTE